MRLFTILLLISGVAWAQEDYTYSVDRIPAELKENSHAVIRLMNYTFTILARNQSRVHVSYATTLLDDKAKREAFEQIPYDKNSKVTSFKGAVYDAAGKPVKRLKPSEIYDGSSYDGVSLFSDNRFKAADLTYHTYPYTVEYEYDIEYKFLYHISDPGYLQHTEISAEKISYTIIYPNDLKPRYKLMNVDQEPKIADLGKGISSMSWVFQNLKPLKPEPFGPDYHLSRPHVMAAPSTFEYDGYAGKMNTWKEFGEWLYQLGKGRNTLPLATQQRVKELTQNCKTVEEKVKVLYEFMQGRTRYVSIQLGIGGYQPFSAETVDQTGYGDCKALSNYMVSLLGEAGVKSYYTVVNSGDDEFALVEDFPSNQFNHVIVSVPMDGDTLWLECTNQSIPFGYIGTFTGDRKVLMITENGGVIARTTDYPASVNVQSTTAHVSIDEAGHGFANVQARYSGLQYENGGLSFLLSDQYDEQKKWIQQNIGIPTFDIVKYKFSNRKDKIPTAIVDLGLGLPRLATVNGKRVFLTANLMNRLTYIPEKVENRKTKVVLRSAWTDFDTIRYSIPENLYPEHLPEPIKISSPFGEYEASFTMDQGSIIYIRRMRREKGEYPPESYNDLIAFYRNVSKADNTKIVLLNKT